MVGRIPVMDVMPVVDLGRLPAKATVGEPLPVRATVFREGHDQLGAEVVLIGPDGSAAPPVRMVADGEVPDRYVAWVTPDGEGAWTFEVQAWSDPLATWEHDAGLKIPAGVDVELMFTEGAAAARAGRRRPDARRPRAGGRPGARVGRPRHRAARRGPAGRAAVPRAASTLLPRTRCASWSPSRAPTRCTPTGRGRCSAAGTSSSRGRRARPYDAKTGTVTSGTFRTAAERLDAVAAMGFDVIYLPPIHPIGEVNRKGPNNTLDPGPDDPGSPWAIGCKDGGHDAIHPDLGHVRGLRRLRRPRPRARPGGRPRPGAAVPRPTTRGSRRTPSGSPPAPTAPSPTPRTRRRSTRTSTRSTSTTTRPGICREVLRIVRLWMSHGVRIFRVDNPHTKPVAFWEWLLREVRRTDPDVLFLAEAFTRPAMMQRPRRDRLPPVLHLLHLAHGQVGDRGLPPRAVDARPTT